MAPRHLDQVVVGRRARGQEDPISCLRGSISFLGCEVTALAAVVAGIAVEVTCRAGEVAEVTDRISSGSGEVALLAAGVALAPGNERILRSLTTTGSHRAILT